MTGNCNHACALQANIEKTTGDHRGHFSHHFDLVPQRHFKSQQIISNETASLSAASEIVRIVLGVLRIDLIAFEKICQLWVGETGPHRLAGLVFAFRFRRHRIRVDHIRVDRNSENPTRQRGRSGN